MNRFGRDTNPIRTRLNDSLVSTEASTQVLSHPVMLSRNLDLKPRALSRLTGLPDRHAGDAQNLPNQEETETGVISVCPFEDPTLHFGREDGIRIHTVPAARRGRNPDAVPPHRSQKGSVLPSPAQIKSPAKS